MKGVRLRVEEEKKKFKSLGTVRWNGRGKSFRNSVKKSEAEWAPELEVTNTGQCLLHSENSQEEACRTTAQQHFLCLEREPELFWSHRAGKIMDLSFYYFRRPSASSTHE